MKCPKCQAENPEGKKFCGECGEKLIQACPQCGFKNLSDDLFCVDCGYNLTQPLSAQVPTGGGKQHSAQEMRGMGNPLKDLSPMNKGGAEKADSDIDKPPYIPINTKETTTIASLISSNKEKFRSPIFIFAGAVFLTLLVFLIFFRYETDQVGRRLIRYDRLTSKVEWKSVFSKSDKWHPSKFKNLQQAKAVFQRRDLENAIEDSVESAIEDRQQKKGLFD